MKKQFLPMNAAKAITYPEQQMIHGPQRVLDAGQYKQLLAACKNQAERTIIRILCEAGLRRSEVLALQVGDLDLERGFILVQRRHYEMRSGGVDVDLPKGRRARTVAVNYTLVPALREHLHGLDHPAKTAPVWTRNNIYTNFTPEPLTGSALYKLVKRIAKDAGLSYDKDTDWISPHILRATGASIAVAAGVPEHIAQKQLGHSRPETTAGYLRLEVTEPLRQFGAVFE